MRILGVLLSVALLLTLPGLAAEKQRVIVLTDITNEPHDEESMVRFLVYANEYDVEGLIATTSVWLRDKVVPEKIRERVEAYGKVWSNLSKHAEGFPTAGSLRDMIKSGRPVCRASVSARGGGVSRQECRPGGLGVRVTSCRR